MGGQDNRTVGQVMDEHPAPWRYTIFNGLVTVLDARDTEVPMFTVLHVAVGVSKAVASSREKKEESPA